VSKEQIYSPPDYEKWIDLIDGRQALIRPVCGADQDSVLHFFSRCTPETRFLRFHYARSLPSPEELKSYCFVDYQDTFTLVAELDKDGKTDIVGAGGYLRLPDSDIAEVAFIVEDTEQGNGIGTQLLKSLTDLAKQRGITHFMAELLTENAIMLKVFRTFAPDLRQIVDGNGINVTFPI
jgi:RimJ/RimL family protein N-acetyltransferase